MFLSDTIGLALSMRSITAVSLQKQGGGFALTRFSCMDFPNEPPSTSVKPLQTFLQAWEPKRRGGRLNVGISTPQMVLRILHMPPMPGSEMRQVLAGELEDYAVLAGSEVVFDFRRMVQPDEQTGSEVLLGAVPQEYSQAHYQRIRQTGLTPTGFDISHLAALRAVVGPETLGSGAPPVMVLLVDSEVSYAVGFRQGQLFFLHPMDIGSLRLEQPAGIEDLLHEFQLCWNYYHADFQDAPSFERIILLLDAPNADEVCSLLSQTMPVESVELGDPTTCLTEITCPLGEWESHRFSAAVAIGLAIGDTAQSGFRAALNLLPTQVMSFALLRPQLLRVGWLLAAVLALIIGTNLHYTSQLRELEYRQDRAQEQTQQLETSQLLPVLELKREVGELQQRLATYENFLTTYRARRRSFLLTWLGNSVPRETWFSRLSCDERGSVVFEGRSSSQEGAFQFLDLVRHSPYFRSPQFTLKQNERQSDSGVSFTLRCKLQKVDPNASTEQPS